MSDELTVDVFPVRRERLSAKEFLKLTREHPSIIERSRVVLGNLGDKNIGEFEVTYTRPIYKALKFRPVAR